MPRFMRATSATVGIVVIGALTLSSAAFSQATPPAGSTGKSACGFSGKSACEPSRAGEPGGARRPGRAHADASVASCAVLAADGRDRRPVEDSHEKRACDRQRQSSRGSRHGRRRHRDHSGREHRSSRIAPTNGAR